MTLPSLDRPLLTLKRLPRSSARLVLIASTLCAGVAHALPLTFHFTGAVTDDPFGSSHFGAPISGSYTFDSAALDVIPGAAVGGYISLGPAFSFVATVDGTAFSSVGSVVVNTVNAVADQYAVTADDGSTNLELFFEDASATAFASDALPLPPPFAAFGFREFRLFGRGVEFLGSVDTFTAGDVPAAIPEPASALLIAAGLLGLALRRRVLKRLAVAVGALVGLVVALPAFAIDGVVLIDQNKALAGNISPGDGPGFPVTISQPGSYRLAGNLTVPDGNTTAIQIGADNVTLDLNGFAILGPVDCTAGCTSTSTGMGVQTFAQPGGAFARFNITVRNGTIQGMGSQGIELTGDSNLVEHVAVRGNGGTGISLIDSRDATRGGGSAVRHSMALRNGGVGISVTRGVVSFNTSSLNAKTGVFVQTGSALYNFISDNTGGLVMGSGNFIGNHMTANSGPAVSGGVNQGQNLCNNGSCGDVRF